MSDLTPEQIINVSVEGLLAAAVDSYEGLLEVKSEFMNRDYSDQVLAIDFDLQTDTFYITLRDKDEVTYEDE